MKIVALFFMEILFSTNLVFGAIGTIAFLEEAPVKWGAVIVGVVWCTISLVLLLKIRKIRKSTKKHKNIYHNVHQTFAASNNAYTKNEQIKQQSTISSLIQTKASSQLKVVNAPETITSVVPKQKRHICSEELDFSEVIQRYLTTGHSKVPAIFDYYSYLRAEFDCLLQNIPHAPIELYNEKVLRGKELLTPFEKTAPITKRTSKAKIANFVVIDVETTGIKTGGNDVIEISAIKFENFIPISIFTTLLKPRKPIPEDATRINGITDEMVQNAPTFAQIKRSLESFVGNYPIVAHNAEFDIKFLHVSGMEFRQSTVFYDTLELSRRRIRETDGTKLPNYRLTTVCNECCIYFDGAHRSSADALATGLLFIEIIKTVFETDNVNSIQFSTNSRASKASQILNPNTESSRKDNVSLKNSTYTPIREVVSDNSKGNITVPTVPVIYPDSSIENVPLSARLLSTSLRCLRTSGSDIYHTHFDCFLYWPEEEKRRFKLWVAILLEDAKAIGLQKCPYCESRDIPAWKAYSQKTYREQIDFIWDPYKSETPISIFEINVKDEMYIASMHRLGEEISIYYEKGEEPMVAFGLTEYCPVPQKIRELCRDDYDSFKMFILKGWLNQNDDLSLQIGVYKRKLWSL